MIWERTGIHKDVDAGSFFSRMKKKAMIRRILNNVRWSCNETRATDL